MAIYCDAVSLAIYLGRALTATEAAAAGAACAASSDFVDRYTGKTWQATTITGELQTVEGRTVRLDMRPVASIQTVTARALTLGETPRVLASGVGYELIDPIAGLLLINEAAGTVLTVAYTLASPAPPAGIALAANIIAAGYLISAPAASLQARGIQKLEAGSAKITYDPLDRSMPMPPAAMALLDLYRPSVAFA